MIYSKRMGGLGNQMYQIATTYATALDNNTDYAVSKDTNENIRVPTVRTGFNKTFLRNIKTSDLPKKMMMYSERDFNYSPIPKNNNIYLRGYFQSARYFDHHREAILELFYEYYPVVSGYIDRIFDQISTETVVSIHVRRADYLKLAHTHPVQSIDYYKKALEHIQKTHPDIYVMIFSDDLEWCKQQPLFKNLPKKHFMGSHGNANDHEMNSIIDLYCMARCNHNIICNSSFSWWGSYLNKHSDKIVVAPSKWFAGSGPKVWNTVYHNMTVI